MSNQGVTMTTTDRQSTLTNSNRRGRSQKFTAEERAAMKERTREARKPTGEPEVLAKIAEMQTPDREIAEKVHVLITSSAPDLAPRTWYGMPAYADQEGKVICHFQPAEKFKTRYATLGFSDRAALDDGAMWPVSFAVSELTSEVQARITALVKQATR